ncbi:uncharacterized protein LOC141687355 [Apium graveolens]|uniref:uncharacterized protein LOC141687355 n=1 Tax=Apium graveolens TaxID=4045 RepID=UPI003D7BE432
MALSVCYDEVTKYWSDAHTGKRLSCPSQGNNKSVVGYMEASDLQINFGSDSNHWKSTDRVLRLGSVTKCYELISVQSLQVHGTYGISSLTEGMRYRVLILVEVRHTYCITGPLMCTLIDSTETRHGRILYHHCREMSKNQIITLHIGQFVARKSLTGDGEIKFSMTNNDKEMKHGIVVVGALIVPLM